MNLVERGLAIGVEGFLHSSECEMLCDLACGREVLEVGSFKGLSCWAMALTAKRVTAVDTFSANSAGQQQMDHYTTLEDFSRATARFTNVRVFPMSSEVAFLAQLADETFDMVFLDAMHTYEDVKADIGRWWPRVRSGGIFAMHDYRHHDFPGVEQAADEIFGPAPEGTTLVTLRWIQK